MENFDYEKAYKAVLQTATQWIKDGCTDKEKICLECVFPELRESEDERIRKSLIKYFSERTTMWDNEFSCQQVLGYLEKQKGNQYFVGYAKGYSEGQLNPKQKKQKPDDLSLDKLVEFFEKTAKQYDIDLPHRGYDIYHLCKDLYNFIYTSLPIPEQKSAEWPEEEMIRKHLINICNEWLGGHSARPCRNDVRWLKNLLEKQKEQKSAWSAEDEKRIRLIISILEDKHPNVFWRSNEMESGVYTEELVDFLKHLRPQSKQEWSEEDEKRYLSCLCRLGTGNPDQPETQNSKWFREHVSPHPHWKPSEEQMNVFKNTLERLRIAGGTGTWYATLESLYEQLKKL